jgi:hypothetical protein
MAVKVKQHKGAWWIFIDHRGKRKAKRIESSKYAVEWHRWATLLGCEAPSEASDVIALGV